MKIILLFLIMALAPSLIMAQASGGQIRRPNQKQQTRIDVQKTSKQNVQLPNIIRELINNMIIVKGGTFTMGATSEQASNAFSDEIIHQVTLSSFSINRYEVTQEEWETVMGYNPSSFRGAKLPVNNVSWDDCQEFISRLNQMTGKRFRLPTEAEWEFAARGGNSGVGRKYSGSNIIDSVVWYIGNSSNSTKNVGLKSSNELGLYDMSGNVWEWCQDWYGGYKRDFQKNPTGASSGSKRVVRGGSWSSSAESCRVSRRYCYTPYSRTNYVGFRLAL